MSNFHTRWEEGMGHRVSKRTHPAGDRCWPIADLSVCLAAKHPIKTRLSGPVDMWMIASRPPGSLCSARGLPLMDKRWTGSA